MIPREIYTLGAVQFDTGKLANLQGQLLAKKAAKDEAVEKYLMDLQTKVPIGQVRTVDKDKFQEKFTNWVKESIAAKGQPDAQQKILTGFQGLMSDAAISKAAGEEEHEVGKLNQKGEIADSDLGIIQRMSKSIYDNDFYKNPDTKQRFTISDFSYNAPTWDIPKREQFVKYAISGMEPTEKANVKTTVSPDGFSTTTTWDKVFSPQQKEFARQNAVAIASDKYGIGTYEKILNEGKKDNPSLEFKQLADVYHRAYPNDLMDNAVKVAQAEVLLKMEGSRGTGTQTTTDWKKRMQYQSSLRKTESKQEVDFADFDVLGEYAPKITEKTIKTIFGTEKIKIVPVREIDKNDYELITKKGEVEPYGSIDDMGDYFIVREDGNWEGRGSQVIDRKKVAEAKLNKTSSFESKVLKKGVLKKKTGSYKGVDDEGNPIYE